MAIQDLKNGLVIGGQLNATFRALLASNEPDVKRAILVEFMDACVVAAWNAQQARIDALMLEYCPEDMTAEQKDEWGRHQRAVEPSETLKFLARPPMVDFHILVDRKPFIIHLPEGSYVTPMEIKHVAGVPSNYALQRRLPRDLARNLSDDEKIPLSTSLEIEFYAVPPAYTGGRREN